MTAPLVRHVDTATFAVEKYRWPLAERRRADIDAHFATLQSVRPALWNGRVLLFRDIAMDGGALTGRAFEADFASFQWWLASPHEDTAIRNVFAMAAVCGADGGFVLGVMGGHTANAGQAYFPAGTPDPADIRDGRVDFAGSVARELAEETGLDAAALRAEPGWTAVCDGPRLALIRRFYAEVSSARLVAGVRDHIAADPGAELADAVAVCRRVDIPAAAPAFMRVFLAAMLAA